MADLVGGRSSDDWPELWGTGTGKVDAVGGAPNAGLPTNAVSPYLLVNRAEVRNIAVALAAREYARLADRVEGSATFDLNPDLGVRGAITEVVFAVRPDGVATTRILIDPALEVPALWSYLPAGIQRKVRRLVT